jgi:hypothetical protein
MVQPDDIIPDPYNPKDWDRYAYVRNSPINHNDPSGHAGCDEDGNCYDSQGWHRAANAPKLSLEDTWKKTIQGKFGITMANGDKSWDADNLQLMFESLSFINNNILNGHVISMVGGATFTLSEHVGNDGLYNGATHHLKTEPTGIDFYTIGTQALRQQNIFHEFGHLLDNVPGSWDAFTNAVASQGHPSWVSSDNKINLLALKSRFINDDPNYLNVEARQTFSNYGPSEQWADAFANYAAGNVDFSDPGGPGPQMYNFVYNALLPYTGMP